MGRKDRGEERQGLLYDDEDDFCGDWVDLMTEVRCDILRKHEAGLEMIKEE